MAVILKLHGILHKIIAPTLLVITSISYEFCSVLTMNVIGNLYSAVVNFDENLFLSYTIQALGVITVVSLLKSMQTYSKERLSVQLRIHGVKSFHRTYFSFGCVYYLSEAKNNEKYIHDPTQRITQDLDKYSTKLAEFMANTVALPVMIIYYSIYLYRYFGLMTVGVCYLYFIMSTFIGRLCLYQLADLAYEQEYHEGSVRSLYFRYYDNSESISMSRGEPVEHYSIHNAFLELVSVLRQIVSKHLYLNLAVDWFTNVGAIGNHSLVADRNHCSCYFTLIS